MQITISGCVAAEHLWSIIKDNPKLKRKVGRFFSETHCLFNVIPTYKGKASKLVLRMVFEAQHLKIVNNVIAGLPEVVKSHMLNVLYATYRQYKLR